MVYYEKYMTKNTKIFLIIMGIIILGVASFYFSYFKVNPFTALVQGNSATSTPKVKLNPADQSTLDESWQVLQKYLKAAKDHDIDELSSLSYQLSDSCKKEKEDESMKKDCEAKMDNVSNIGSTFTKDGIENVWSDKKQILLSTSWVDIENETLVGRFRSIVYFVIDENGNIKILSFKPAQGSFVNKVIKEEGKEDVILSQKEIQSKLEEATHDKDMDGIEDYLEVCGDPGTAKDCVKTDPKKRDTDGNGYWDGVQTLFYK